jgi:hypothetical protein
MQKIPRKKRLSVPMDDAKFEKLNRLIPWGLKYHVIETLIDGLIDMIEKDKDNMVLSAILAKRIPTEIVLKQGLKDGND